MEPNDLIQVKKLTIIEQRRAKLLQELKSLEQGFEGNIDEIKEGLQQKTDPRHWIRRYPMAALGIAVGLGIIAGSSGRRKSTGITVTSQGPTLFGEMKRMLLDRGIAFAVASAEDLLTGRLATSPKRRNSPQEDQN